MEDDYPAGHSSDPDYRTLVNWLTNEMGIIYIFGKINDSTNRKIEVFSTAAGRRLDTFDGKDPHLIEAAVVSSLKASVNAVLARCVATPTATKAQEPKLRHFTIDQSLLDWSALPKLEGRMQSYLMPERIIDIINDRPLMSCEPKKTLVKIAANRFAKGSERIVYNGLDVTGTEPIHVVFKEFKRLCKGKYDANRYELVNQMQMIAAFMAIEIHQSTQFR